MQTERLKQQQDRERAERNAASVLAWHVREFGEVVGPQIADLTGLDRHLAVLRAKGAL